MTMLTAAEAADAARERRRDDPAWQRKRVERQIAAPHMGRFEWRIVAEAVWGVAGWLGMIVLAMNGVVPMWLACLVNGALAYCLYMPMHEATHNNVQGRHSHLGWVNDWVGRVSCIPIGFSFRAHKIDHMRHHAFTNDPVRDPDIYTKGSLQSLPLKFAIVSALQLVVPLLMWLPDIKERLSPKLRLFLGFDREMTQVEARALRNFGTLQLAAMLGLSLAGYFSEMMLLFYIPSLIGVLTILVVFAWLPHHPHSEFTRYRNTRATLFPGSGLLIRGHDRHLIHHMIPLIPHYRIPAVFEALRPMLQEQGARIEGPNAGPGAPRILVSSDPAAIERAMNLASH